MARYKKQKGAVLVISMIFLCIFAAWAVSIGAKSGVNLQLADNHQKANCARASAESGLEVLRFLLADFSVPASVAPADRLTAINSFVDDEDSVACDVVLSSPCVASEIKATAQVTM